MPKIILVAEIIKKDNNNEKENNTVYVNKIARFGIFTVYVLPVWTGVF